MTLKYKVGDRVQVNAGAGFSAYSKGVVVEDPVPGIGWPLNRVFVLRDGATEACWFYPEELALLKAAETSKESGLTVQKISVENDVVSSAVNTSVSTCEDKEKNVEFKVGDKVKLVARCYEPSVAKGSILNVVKDGQLGAYWINKESVEVSMLNAYSEEFKLVEGNQPKAQDNSWYENGELPPVGEVCEVDWCGEWHSCEIIAHFMQAARMVAAFTVNNGCGVKSLYAFQARCFRPMQTDEEIAKQERAAYCDRIYAVLCKAERKDNRSDMAEALYDAGLRFVEEE